MRRANIAVELSKINLFLIVANLASFFLQLYMKNFGIAVFNAFAALILLISLPVKK